MSTQLYAKIRRSSEHSHQYSGRTPFPVVFRPRWPGDADYVFAGNDNVYRINDLRFYVKAGERFLQLS